MATDYAWCFDNPHEAAQEVDCLVGQTNRMLMYHKQHHYIQLRRLFNGALLSLPFLQRQQS